MPLPAALLAKLAQRGIVKDQPEKKAPENEEEVFAEDYDESDSSSDSNDEAADENDQSENSDESDASLDQSDESESEENQSESLKVDAAIKEHVTRHKCPNANNPYHECSPYCVQKYGDKKFEPHPVMERRRLRMLKIYPLLPGWREVPDLNTNRFYYWNVETDQVCWLSPSHPRARYTSVAASADAKKVHVNAPDETEDIGLHASLVPAYHDSKPKPKPHYKPHQNKHKKESDAIDPMDPASYSDIKRGKWSDGMDSAPSVKIGSSVDEN